MIYNDRRVWYEMKRDTPGLADIVYGATLPTHVSDWKNPPSGSLFGNYDYYGEKVSSQAKTYSKSSTASASLRLFITSDGRALNPYAKALTISFGE